MLGNADLIAASLPPEREIGEEMRDLQTAARHGQVMVRKLLGFARQGDLELQPANLGALTQDIGRTLRRVLPDNVAVEISAGAELPAVLAHGGAVEQVLLNLATNARDAMASGGALTIRTANVELDERHVRARTVEDIAPYVMLAVSDSGAGMDAETLAHAFEPFFTTKEPGSGTGLGLSTVYGIVKQSEGFVWAFSETGRGATFEMYLPRAERAEDVWQPADTSDASGARRETVLLVDDNNQLRVVSARALRNLGYKVVEANGLEQARRIAATEAAIQLLLTDVVMPGGGGRDVSAAVRDVHPAAKVLFMSGFTDDVIGDRGVLEPGVQLLHKPFAPDVLGRRVRQVLEGNALG